MHLFIGIVIVILLLLLFPPLRALALLVFVFVVIFIVGFLIYQGFSDSASKSLIPINEIKITNLKLVISDLNQLTGEVQNNSSHQLDDLQLKVVVYDCPSTVIAPECTIIGEDDNIDPLISIPSHQVRSMSVFVSLTDMPKIKGNFLWSYSIVGTKGSN